MNQDRQKTPQKTQEPMQRVVLVAESGSDITPALAAAHGIQVVPMHVSFGAESRDDGTFPAEEICAFYDRTGILPKTSGCTPEDFERAFDAIRARNPRSEILHLAYSAVTTCSYQSARIAAEGREAITSVDTRQVTIGQCAVVVETARLLEAHPEWELAQAAEAAQGLARRARMCFIPGELEFLRAGGRVSNAAAMCGRLLGIHPLIEILEGRLQATRKLRGRMEVLIPRLVEAYIQANRLDRREIWMVRTPRLAPHLVEAAQEAARRCGVQTVRWIPAGGVITAHGGPGAFGIAGFCQE